MRTEITLRNPAEEILKEEFCEVPALDVKRLMDKLDEIHECMKSSTSKDYYIVGVNISRMYFTLKDILNSRRGMVL